VYSYNRGIRGYDIKGIEASQGISIMKYYKKENMKSYVYMQACK
jgi:hypothetical protein